MRRPEHDLPDRRSLVVDVADLGDEARVVEGIGSAERDLFLRGENQLDSRVRAALVEDPLCRLEQDDDRRLVVRAEDRPRCVSDDAVLTDDGLDGALGRDGVGMRAEEDRRAATVRGWDPAVDVPRVSLEPRGRVVLVPVERRARSGTHRRGRQLRAPAPTGSGSHRARGRGRRAARSTVVGCSVPQAHRTKSRFLHEAASLLLHLLG